MTLEKVKRLLKFLEDNNIKDIAGEIEVEVLEDTDSNDCPTGEIGACVWKRICDFDNALIKKVEEIDNNFVIKDCKLNFIIRDMEQVRLIKNEYKDKNFKVTHDNYYNNYHMKEI